MNKKEMRAFIAQQKEITSPTARLDLSGPILRKLAVHPKFMEAKTVLLYHSLPDEVDTHDFVRFWSSRKCILLPTVKGKEIELHRFQAGDSLLEGPFGIQESMGEVFTDYQDIDLAVIPGVAFDRQGNRLGRGMGFYDRLLTRLQNCHIYKLGVCFDYQKVENVPTDEHDVPMDEVL